MPKRESVALALALLAAAGLARAEPIVFLRSRSGAQWVLPPVTTSSGIRRVADQRVLFRHELQLDSARRARLEVTALKRLDLFVDGRPVLSTPPGGDWTRPQSVELPLTAGSHELVAAVSNDDGPPALRLSAPGLDVGAPAAWLASEDGRRWLPAQGAAEEVPRRERDLPSAWRELARRWPAFLAVFVLAFLSCLKSSAPRAASWLARAPPLDQSIRLLAWLSWAVLALANLRLPLSVGFDVPTHYTYLGFVSTQARLPLPGQGWNSWQAPLFYILDAPVLALGRLLRGPDLGAFLARLLPLACGALQIELARRAARAVFPGRAEPQALAMLAAAFMPVNRYISQYVGNEPLSGLLAGWMLVLALEQAAGPPPKLPAAAKVGVLWGLALLAKPTALAAAIPLLVLAFSRWPARQAARLAGVCLACALLVCGWYFRRNWLLFGRPFLGGWEAQLGTGWWQDPGFRTPAGFLFHWRALGHPVLAGFGGYWDGLYTTLWADGQLSGSAFQFLQQPFWDYGFMAAGALLALPMTAAAVGGAARAFWSRRDGAAALRLCVVAVAAYAAAILYVYLRVPYYSVVKASYALGALPCLAVLIAAGLEPLLRRGRPWRSLCWGVVACWAAASFLAYLA